MVFSFDRFGGMLTVIKRCTAQIRGGIPPLMKIIDAHLHMNKNPHFDALAEAAGHQNSLPALLQDLAAQNVAGCVVMGTGRQETRPGHPGLFDLAGDPDPVGGYRYPQNVAFCIGVDPEGLRGDAARETLARYEQALQCPNCVGFKIYLGYKPYYADDPIYHPVYALARRYNLTVAFHTGDTANPTGRLRFAHPLTVDEVAVRFPTVRLVLCHCGNPWVCDAAEVAKKNEHVYLDLSGLAEGQFSAEAFVAQYGGYHAHLRCWLEYLDRWDRVLYGSDWPLVNLQSNIALIKTLVPQQHWPAVFYQNALAAYPKLQGLL